jgi:hypothetical protein
VRSASGEPPSSYSKSPFFRSSGVSAGPRRLRKQRASLLQSVCRARVPREGSRKGFVPQTAHLLRRRPQASPYDSSIRAHRRPHKGQPMDVRMIGRTDSAAARTRGDPRATPREPLLFRLRTVFAAASSLRRPEPPHCRAFIPGIRVPLYAGRVARRRRAYRDHPRLSAAVSTRLAPPDGSTTVGGTSANKLPEHRGMRPSMQ